MGHYTLSAIKGQRSHDYITSPCRARDEAQEAKDSAQEEPATIAEVMSARHRPGEDTGRRLLMFCELHQRPRAGKLKPAHGLLHSRDAVPESVSIGEHLLCVSQTHSEPQNAFISPLAPCFFPKAHRCMSLSLLGSA